MPPLAARGAGQDETEEGLARQRRVMFVAMTRAMRVLLVVTPDRPSPLFTGFDPQLWNADTAPVIE
jgi:superfamily I DNA/RNA helicase